MVTKRETEGFEPLGGTSSEPTDVQIKAPPISQQTPPPHPLIGLEAKALPPSEQSGSFKVDTEPRRKSLPSGLSEAVRPTDLARPWETAPTRMHQPPIRFIAAAAAAAALLMCEQGAEKSSQSTITPLSCRHPTPYPQSPFPGSSHLPILPPTTLHPSCTV